MTAFFWMFWILAGVLVIQCVAKRVRMVGESIKNEQRSKERFATQCWRARLRRETEPTGIVHHEYDGHHYVAISHGLAEVPALYLSMRRMVMEVENSPKLSIDGKEIPVVEWSATPKGKKLVGESFTIEGRYLREDEP